MVRYLFYTFGDLTYQSPLVAYYLGQSIVPHRILTLRC